MKSTYSFSLLLLIMQLPLNATTLFLAGDSTMANKDSAPENPERGWGEVLGAFFEESITIDNRAINGRSTLSFRTEGRWEELLESVQAGDYVLIQFGHNDQKSEDPSRYAEADTEYRRNLTQMIDEVKSKDAHPLLATSIVRRRFDENGQLIDTHSDYPKVVREVAVAKDVPLLDLEKLTRELIQSLGSENSKEIFLHVKPNQFKRFPDGLVDDTHLTIYGASVIAQLAVEELLAMNHPLSKSLLLPVTNYTNTEWFPLYSGKPPSFQENGGDELLIDERIHNVHIPTIGIFKSPLINPPKPAIIICPGGGYGLLSIENEGVAVARWFNALGFDAFVLKYRLKEYGFPVQLQDMQRAVRIVRANAEEWGIDPIRIGVFGSSAGSHMAGMAATLWDHPKGLIGDDLDSIPARPDFVAMLYPVVSMDESITHMGSRTNLTQSNNDPELIELLSIDKQVNAQTPPIFLVHGRNDPAVPSSNSLVLAQQLNTHNIPFELHLYEEGRHGFGMQTIEGPIGNWLIPLAEWLEYRNLLKRNHSK